METQSTGRSGGKLFVVIFVVLLAVVVASFIWFVQTANSILPQEDEVISVEEAAARIEAGEIERILIQEERDLFLYRPGQDRPLYAQLDEGAVFTTTMQALGIPQEQFPPLIVEPE